MGVKLPFLKGHPIAPLALSEATSSLKSVSGAASVLSQVATHVKSVRRVSSSLTVLV